jgi:outer membrane biosynthesis protein TonB
MAVLCDLGLHRPAPWPRWNLGYYFTKCERCGEDLVRTANGRWQIPRGFRVRWQGSPPEKAHLQTGGAALQPDEAPADAKPVEPPLAPEAQESPEATEAPAQPEPEQPAAHPPAELLAPDPVEPPAPPPEPVAPRPSSRIPDFMREGPDDTPKPAPSETATTRAPLIPPRAAEREERADAPRSLLPMLTGSSETAASPTEGGLRHAVPVIGFFLIVIVAALALALVRWPSMRGEASAPGTAGNSAAQLPQAPLPQAAFRVAVEASLLNCRAAPAQEAQVLQRLGYGETAQLMERGPQWAQIDTGRRQCWVLEQHLSAPLDL